MKVESLEFEVVQSGETAATGIDRLKDSLEKLNSVAQVKSLPTLARHFKKLRDSISDISAESIERIERLAAAMEKLSSATGATGGRIHININDSTGKNASAGTSEKDKDNEPISDDVKSILESGEHIDVVRMKAQALKEDLSEAIDGDNLKGAINKRLQLDSTNSNIDKLNQKLEEAKRKAENIPKISDKLKMDITSGSEIDVLTAKLEILKKKMAEALEAGNAEKAISIRGQIDSVTKSIEKLNSAIEKTGKKASSSVSSIKKFVKAIARIALYRAIRTAIKEITDAMKEGLENAYFYSKTVNGTLYNTMNELSSRWQTGVNQWGAALGELIELVKPFLIWVLNALTKIAEKLTQFFAALNGKTTYLKATDVVKEWKEDTESGAKAAKEWKNQLLGFDEINRLDDNSSSGSSGSSGTDYSTLYEEVPLEPWALKLEDLVDKVGGFFDKVKDKIRGGLETVAEWVYNLGLITEEQLNDIKEKLRNLFPTPNTEPMKSGAIEAFGVIQEEADAVEEYIGSKTPVMNFKPLVSEFGKAVLSCVAFFLGGYITIKEWFAKGKEKAIATFEDIKVGFCEKLTNGLLSFVAVCAAIVLEYNRAKQKVIEGFQAVRQSLKVGIALAEATIVLFFEFVKGRAETTCLQLKAKIDSVYQKVKTVVTASISLLSSLSAKAAEVINKVNEAIAKSKELNTATSKGYSTSTTRYGDTITTYEYESSAMTFLDKIASMSSIGSIASIFGTIGSLSAILGFASGGFPTSGDLFFANEGGVPEYVGSIGNQTAVANNDQIVEGIERGVYRAMTNAMANNKSGSNSVTLNVNGKQFCRAIYSDFKSVSNEHGISLVNA